MNCRIIAVLAVVAMRRKQTFTLSQATFVAGTLLPAGGYQVTHEM